MCAEKTQLVDSRPGNLRHSFDHRLKYLLANLMIRRSRGRRGRFLRALVAAGTFDRLPILSLDDDNL